MMDLPCFYSERIEKFTRAEAVFARRNALYARLRLLTVVVAMVSGVYFYSVLPWLSMVLVFACLTLFLICLKQHLKCMEQQKEAERFGKINRQELDGINGDHSAYQAGEQYIDPKHGYTSDLDIFGTHSVFRYVNRTVSPSGSRMLAAWLSRAASTPEIEYRQEAVKELAGKIDWRQSMQCVSLKHEKIDADLPDFLHWLQQEAVLSAKRRLLPVMRILPWITSAYTAGACMGWLPVGGVWLLVSVHLIISMMVVKKVNILHRQVSRKVAFISTYADLISLFVGAGFTSPRLAMFREIFVNGKALEHIRALSNRIKRLDYRLNMMFIPVNLLFFFDCRHLLWLEKWRTDNGRKLPEWFDVIAETEALSSFANLLFNNPEWTMPEIKDGYFTLKAVNAGHPLILAKERVCNDFLLEGEGKIAVVTGSNMSGKSTFERSIGVNTVLALAGAPVCAERFAVTNCRLYTCMRIADNLEERTSSFYAELKRLKQLIEIGRNGERVFFLLDEVLRGTNSRDRQIGSMALVRQLARQHVSGIIATHDLTLGELETELPDNVYNAHFDVQINGDDMSFDYRLHRGICTSLNASILMKKIGIEV
jgi:hypothetical protein